MLSTKEQLFVYFIYVWIFTTWIQKVIAVGEFEEGGRPLGHITEAGIQKCSSPPRIDNALHNGTEQDGIYVVDSVIAYRCDRGYLNDGNHKNTIQCYLPERSTYPTWTSTKFRCKPQSCPHPGDIPNGQRQGHVFTFPNQVTYSCHAGYELQGVKTRYCQPNGKWTGSLPRCKVVNCPEPEQPINGRVTFQSTVYKSLAQYECLDGFVLRKGSSLTRTCQANAQWSNDVPICEEISCPELKEPENGSLHLLSGSTKVGSIAIFKCDPNTIMDGSSQSKCMNKGDWSFPEPRCIPRCRIPDFLNGEIGIRKQKPGRNRWSAPVIVFEQLQVGTFIDPGQSVLIRCHSRYGLSGRKDTQREITCDNGSWRNLEPCLPEMCQIPHDFRNKNFRVFIRKYDDISYMQPTTEFQELPLGAFREHGKKVIIQCSEGYVVSGGRKYQQETICEYGSWKKFEPCLPEECRNPPRISDGKPVKEIIPHGDIVEYKCNKYGNQQYVLENSYHMLTCDKGKFVGNVPTCNRPTYCENPTSVSNGRPKFQRFESRQNVQYVCNEGYHLVQSDYSRTNPYRCLDGEFRGTPPNCEKDRSTYCENPPPIPNGRPKSLRIQNGGIVEYECQWGYYISEWDSFSLREPLQCRNGEFRGNLPICIEILETDRCSIPHIEGGVLLKENPDRTARMFFTTGELNSSNMHEPVFLACAPDYTKSMRVYCIRGWWQPPTLYTFCTQDRSSTIQPAITVPSLQGEPDEFRGQEPRYPLSPKSPSGQNDAALTSPVSVRRQTNTTPEEDATARPLELIANLSRNDTGTFEGSTTHVIPPGVPRSCIMPEIPNSVVAFTNFYPVVPGKEVPSSEDVFFHCSDIGIHIMKGPKKWSCINGEWHTSEIPTCAYPESGNSPIILVDKNNAEKILIGQEGHVILEHPRQLKILCLTKNGRSKVRWEYTLPFDGNSIEQTIYDASIGNVTILGLTLTTLDKSGTEKLKCVSETSNEDRTMIFDIKATNPRNAETLNTDANARNGDTSVNVTTNTESPETASSLPVDSEIVTIKTRLEVKSGPLPSPVTETFSPIIPSTSEPAEKNEPTHESSLTTLPSLHEFTRPNLQTANESSFNIDSVNNDQEIQACIFAFQNENVEGFANGKRLQRGQSVPHNTTVSLHCKHFGVERFQGSRKLLCNHTNWIPASPPHNPDVNCRVPQNRAAPFIYFDVPEEQYEIRAGGVLTVLQSSSLRLSCNTRQRTKWPVWTIPNGVFKTEQYNYSVDGNMEAHLIITRTRTSHSGTYSCKVATDYNSIKEHKIVLNVIDGCDISDFYRVVEVQNAIPELINDRRFYLVDERLQLACESHHQLEGNGTLTCKAGRTWSSVNVRCIPGCPPPVIEDPVIQVTGLKKDTYKVGDSLSFQCPRGYTISTSYVSIVCFNGSWSKKEMPRCNRHLTSE